MGNESEVESLETMSDGQRERCGGKEVMGKTWGKTPQPRYELRYELNLPTGATRRAGCR